MAENFSTSLTINLEGNILKKIKSVRVELNKLQRAAGKSSNVTVQMTRNLNRGGNAMNRLKNQSVATSRAMGGLKRTVVGLAGVVGGVQMVRGIASLTGQWRSGLAKVSTLTDGGLETVRAKFGGHFKELAVMSGQSVTNVLEGAYQSLSAGVKESNLVPFMKVASKVAVSGFTDVKTAVDGLTNVTNAWGISSKQAANVFLMTQNLGKTTVGEIARAIGSVGAQAKDLNMSFADVGSAIAGVTSLGGTGVEAVTGLKSVLKALSKPTREQAKAFNKLGMTINTDTVRTQGFQKTMTGLVKAIKLTNLPLAEQDKLLSQIFGRQEAITFIKKFTSPKGLEKSAELLKQNAEGVDVLEGNFKKMEKTMAFKRAKVRLQNLAITIGDKMAPAMQKFSIWAEKGIAKFEKWIQSNPQILTDLKNLAAAFFKVGVTIGKTLLPVLVQMGKIITPILSAAAKFLSTNPTLIKALIGAAVGGKLIGMLGRGGGFGGSGGVGGKGGGVGMGQVFGAGIFATMNTVAAIKSMNKVHKERERAAGFEADYQEVLRKGAIRRSLIMAKNIDKGGVRGGAQFLMEKSQFDVDINAVSEVLERFRMGSISQQAAMKELELLAPVTKKQIVNAFKKGLISKEAGKSALENLMVKEDARRGVVFENEKKRAETINNMLTGSGGGLLGMVRSQTEGFQSFMTIGQGLKTGFADPLVQMGKGVASVFSDIFGMGKKATEQAKKTGTGTGGGGGVILGKGTSLKGTNIKQTNNIKPVTTVNINVSLASEQDVNKIQKQVEDSAVKGVASATKKMNRLSGVVN